VRLLIGIVLLDPTDRRGAAGCIKALLVLADDTKITKAANRDDDDGAFMVVTFAKIYFFFFSDLWTLEARPP
jgi:hypothetical protein